ncbi:MAG: aminotransferase class I/II-fold pyridoxal phosphate-dependent enzyme [Rhizobiaceae bacterium]|nr:aminotransferase class I/II-fold pyridoxal phosphate-dependent enzyme [Rhizobiaceae bacterium]
MSLSANQSSEVGDTTSDRLLQGVAQDHYAANQRDLIRRWLPIAEWFDERCESELDPYQKVSSGRILPTVAGSFRNGRPFTGVNFASQDYLSLASHERLISASTAAAEEFGVHSAGSAALMGGCEMSKRLETALEHFLGYQEVTLFPTGWTAGYGIVKMLAQPGDHIVIDVLAHACLQEGANGSRASVHRFPHLSNSSVQRRLSRIRSAQPEAGILVVTETLFSMDSDSPWIADLQALCSRYGATLLVDCAHDLGCMGETGRGVLEVQEMVGKVDVLMGSFSKTFASIGGFVATQHSGLRTAMRACCGPQTFTNAMTPIQAAVVLEALNIVTGPEGAVRRKQLADNIAYLRARLSDHGFVTPGEPSAIVPVVVGDSATARLMTRHMIREGAIVNLVEYPAVARGKSFWRVQVMADHERQHIDAFIKCALEARRHWGGQPVTNDRLTA